MKKIFGALVAISAVISAPATAQNVSVGTAKWESLPLLQMKGRPLPYADFVGKVEKMLASEACSFPGQSAEKFNITVPFAVRIEPDGKVSQVLVSEMQCTPLETFVGQIVLALIGMGDVKTVGGPKARWYKRQISFSLQ